MQDRRAAHAARRSCSSVDVGPRTILRVRRISVVVLGANDVHLPAPDTDFHQLDKICPHGSPFVVREKIPRSFRVDSVTKEKFGAVDVADTRQDRLVHEQRADRLLGLGDSQPGFLRIRVAAQRVRPESRLDRGDLRGQQNFAGSGTTKVVPKSAPTIRIRTWPTGSSIGRAESVNFPYSPRCT